MSEDEKIAIKEFICILKDRNWHDLYEFHATYNLSAILIVNSLEVLLKLEIIVKDGRKIRLSENLDNKKLATINLISKTKKPEILGVFNRKLLPRWQHRV